MTANTGPTNTIWLGVWIDNSAGTLTDLSIYCLDPGSHGLEFAKAVQTGIGERIENFTLGNPSAPLKMKFRFDTVVAAHFVALLAVTPRAPLSIDFRHGIGHAWESGEPTFGMTSSATSGYLLTKVDFSDVIDVEFDVVGGVAPTFLTAAHT